VSQPGIDQESSLRLENPVPFATEGVRAFYGSLVRRYYKLFGGMMLLSIVYAAITSGRILALGALIEAVKANNGVGSESLTLFPAVEEGLAFLGFQPLNLAERLQDPSYFATFLVGAAVVFTVAATVMVIASFFKEYLGQALVVGMVVDIRNALFRHLTQQSVAYFNRQRSGDVMSRLTNDIAAVQLSFRFFFQTVVHEPLTIVGTLAVALFIHPGLFCTIVPLYALLVWPIARSAKKVRKHGRGRLEKLSVVTEGIHQLFSGIRVVKAFGMEQHEQAEFADKNRAYIRSTLKMNRAKIKGRSLQELLYNLGTAAVLLLGVWLLASDAVTIQAFAMFLAAMMQIYTPIKSFSRAWNQIQESTAGVQRLLEMLRQRPDFEDKVGAEEFLGVQRSIDFDGVSFSYGVDAAGETTEASTPCPIIRDLSFDVKRGEVIALVGPSGAGKSTVVDLLARFYEPQSGRVAVDGTDIRDFRHSSYLGGIAIVSQDPFLFNATIRTNIAYGRPGATKEEVEEAAKVAYAHDFIVEQPEGYETVLGERGVKLSGGQRQRLTIARAVLKNAPILILDEATSALDSESEKVVQRAMDNLMRARTTFIIAHRLSTIVHADKILVLEDGCLVEAGRHDELLAREGSYYRLWRSQNLDKVGGRQGEESADGVRR
jgi:subfamily B ATP-binding cassette protein MsbA